MYPLGGIPLTPSLHPLASQSLPIFISSPGGADYLLIGMAIFLVAFVLAIGILYLNLHALPDHIAHRSQKVQYEVVCVLGLLAMFTHIHAFWIAGLLLALIDIPDIGTPLRRISEALDRIATDRRRRIAVSGVAREQAAGETVLPQPSTRPSRTSEKSLHLST